MKKQRTRRERLKLSSIAFMRALKPKINRSGKQKKENVQNRQSTILLGRIEEKLSGYPGTV